MPSSRPFADALVIDAGPALALARADLLGLPGKLFSAALLPQPAYAECLARPERADAIAMRGAIDAGQILLADVPGGNEPPSVAGLGAGEVAVIRLCLERKAIALLDDKLARRAALNAGLQVLGVVGLLRLAKEHRLILALRPILEALRQEGYFLSPQLVEETLRAAGE